MSVSLNPFMDKQAVNISRDAGGVGIQLPQRFAARQQAAISPASPESEFGGDDADLKDFMRDIANPNKLKNESDTDSNSGSSGVSIDYEGDGNLYDSSPESEKQQKFYEETPSSGFLSIADEKADILFRLEVLRRQGIEPRKFTARDDLGRGGRGLALSLSPPLRFSELCAGMGRYRAHRLAGRCKNRANFHRHSLCLGRCRFPNGDYLGWTSRNSNRAL
jgi:hypothetical protein